VYVISDNLTENTVLLRTSPKLNSISVNVIEEMITTNS